MKKGTIAALLVGASIGTLPGYGAIASQTDWLDTPQVLAADYEWEQIPETGAPWDADTMNTWLENRPAPQLNKYVNHAVHYINL